jgi:transcriptional regulator with GAF, ATPase, and Fis domain
MSRHGAVDPIPYITAVSGALRQRDQPRAVFAALDHALASVLGHKLFTLLMYHPDQAQSERCYTNQPIAYPVGGRKPITPSPWTESLFQHHRPYIGHTAEDIREVFPDHELIASLGCASVLNVPIVWSDRTLGTMNLLHEAHWYDDGDVSIARVFAALAVPAFLSLTRPSR